jgi:primosomal protein N' (replication factor Y)
MSVAPRYARVAVPSPLPRHFDYLLPSGEPVPLPGTRVRVPFGRQETVGVVLGVAMQSDLPREKLKTIRRRLDAEPLLPPVLMELLTWASACYHHPIGEVMASALPVLLRRGYRPRRAEALCMTDDARASGEASALTAQRRLVQILREHAEDLNARRLRAGRELARRHETSASVV